MPSLPLYVHCKVCNVTTPARFGHTLFGLRAYICPVCQTKHIFNMASRTKYIYLAFCVLLLAAAAQGATAAAYLLLFVGFAFYKDLTLKQTTPPRADIVAAPSVPDEAAPAEAAPNAAAPNAAAPNAAAPDAAASKDQEAP